LSKGIVTPLGSPLKEEDIEAQKVLSVTYQPKANYKWATGIAIGKFLEALKAGRILGSKCNRCQRIVVPPRIFCEFCFRRINDWVQLADSGTVNTYSVSHIATDTKRLKTPIIPAVIEIDGTSKAGFLHILGGVDPDKVKIGMRVKAVWKEPNERSGSITDIKYFSPTEK
jgi:hypothetical protein